MSVQIGNVKSVGHAENYSFDFDDRQEIVKTVNGAVVVDPWEGSRVADGDVISFEAAFSFSDAQTIKSWWAARTKKTVILDDDTTIANARIVVRGVDYINLFWKKFVKLRLEIWKV